MNGTMYNLKNLFTQIPLICAVLLLSACASTTLPNGEINDPLEGMNRKVFAFNTAVDKAVLKPVGEVYDTVLPKPVKSGIRNFLANLREPYTFLNDLLQFKPGRAMRTLSRFLTNSTVGLGGLFDVAGRSGLKRHTEDFGQTLAHWGFEGGPYIVLPIFGPSTVRDAGGRGLEFFAEPVGYYADQKNKEMWDLGRNITMAIDASVQFRQVLDNMYLEPDPYAYARSAFLQNRAYQIRDGKREMTTEEDLFGDFEDEEGQE